MAELADRGREETREERADRNSGELLSELRVALPGVRVLFAFGGTTAGVTGAIVLLAFALLWYAVPLRGRSEQGPR